MRHPLLLAGAVAIATVPIGLFACSERRQPPADAQIQQMKALDVGMPPAAPSSPGERVAPPPLAAPSTSDRSTTRPEPPDRASAIIAATAPSIAYSYGYRFRVAAAAVAPLQERHLQLCLALGENRCRVVSMRRSETRAASQPVLPGQPLAPPDAEPGASLELQVAAALAERFGRELSVSTGQAGGETVDRQISAEDLSRDMVDSEARIRTRETLIRRLSTLLETRSGNIQQAVEAERAINEAQEEVEAARTWLGEMRGRVAMARVAIQYEPAGADATPRERNPIAASWSQIGALTTQSLAALLLVAGVILPWLGIGLLVMFAARWHRRRTQPPEAVAG